MKNRDTKSIAYAFISNDVNVYFPSEEKEYFVFEKLVCKDCKTFWHTALIECYLCGELNYYLYRCVSCGKHYSITKSIKECSACKSREVIKVCVNPNCITNTHAEIRNLTIKDGGVFDLASSFKLSLMFCVNCGSPDNFYNSQKIFVYNDKMERNFADYLKRIEQDLSNEDIIIVKTHSDILRYNYLKVAENSLQLPNSYPYENINHLIATIISL